MNVRFLGHAAVLLSSRDDTTLLIDPYNPGGFDGKMAYGPIGYQPDAVVCSHDHVDHCGTSHLTNTPVKLDGPASFGPFDIRRHRAAHDEYDGRRRGGHVDLLEITADGSTVVHLSDVGQSPTEALVQSLGGIDLLLVPVGGFFTIGPAQAHQWVRRLAPRQVVPIHYKTARCRLQLHGREVFESYLEGRPDRPTDPSCVELRSAMVSLKGGVALLQPEC